MKNQTPAFSWHPRSQQYYSITVLACHLTPSPNHPETRGWPYQGQSRALQSSPDSQEHQHKFYKHQGSLLQD